MIGATPLLDFMLVDLFDRPVSKLIHTPGALLRDKYLMRPLVLLDRSHYSQVPQPRQARETCSVQCGISSSLQV